MIPSAQTHLQHFALISHHSKNGVHNCCFRRPDRLHSAVHEQCNSEDPLVTTYVHRQSPTFRCCFVCASDLLSPCCSSLEPWMHVLCVCGGAWAANKWVQAEANLLEDVNELRAYKGLPPLAGSHNWVPFVPPSFDSKGK